MPLQAADSLALQSQVAVETLFDLAPRARRCLTWLTAGPDPVLCEDYQVEDSGPIFTSIVMPSAILGAALTSEHTELWTRRRIRPGQLLTLPSGELSEDIG